MHIHRQAALPPDWTTVPNQPTPAALAAKKAAETRKKLASFGSTLAEEQEASPWTVTDRNPYLGPKRDSAETSQPDTKEYTGISVRV